MSTAKFEKLIDLIINEEQEQARALFHEIVVEQSRSIYESMSDTEETDDGEFDVSADNEAEDFVSDISDEVEADEEGDIESSDDFESDEDEDEDAGEDEDLEDHAEELEDRVEDLEVVIDELRAELDELLAAEENEEENFPGIHDDSEEDLDDDSEDDSKTVREYVEKVRPAVTSEPTGAQTASPVAKKNNMGGTAKNIATGGAASYVPTPKSQPVRSGNFDNTVGHRSAGFKKV